MQIKLSEIVEALDNTDVNTRYCYYIPEERIILMGEEDLDEKQLIPLPTHKEIDDYHTMRSFIEQLDDTEAAEWLEEAIKGAGAFRRFRSTLERFVLTDKWLDYLQATHEGIAIDWCEYYGIEYLSDDPFAYQEEIKEPKIIHRHNYRIINIDEDNAYGLVYLVQEFRKTLSAFRNLKYEGDVDDALEELKYYLKRGYPVYAVSDNGRYIAYAVCRIDGDVVWLESIFVRKEYRRKGIGKMLLDRAEALSEEYDNDTLYFYVHPNNHEMLNFLKVNGYDVLNLIEIRKAYQDEKFQKTYTLEDHEYRY
ncbi:MAG: GNAT family N-acetyltransferase [Erysipelotrichaceae bacterium]|nr:GNAT family N-acetyltransferase [Erysipelotrichaceae bacterium]